MDRRIRNLTGQRFGRLVAESMAVGRDNNHVVWRCRCDCGVELDVRSSSLVVGQTKSCGCYAREAASTRSKTHGMSSSREAGTWRAMRDRCTNPKHHAYSRYGGRGIKVCEAWLASIENFYADMGPRPENTTLDHIDNNKGYCKENCRWANWTEQQNNRRSTRYLLLCGVVMSVSEWSRVSGVPKGTITKRANSGFSTACSIFAPVNHGMFRLRVSPEEVSKTYDQEFTLVARLELLSCGRLDLADAEPRPMNEQEMSDLRKYLMSTIRRVEVKQ